jgi:hypothetical protein
MIFLKKYFFYFIFNINIVENLILFFFLFIFSFYVACEFIEITRITLVYKFGEVIFLIELVFYIVYFFSYFKKNSFIEKPCY